MIVRDWYRQEPFVSHQFVPAKGLRVSRRDVDFESISIEKGTKCTLRTQNHGFNGGFQVFNRIIFVRGTRHNKRESKMAEEQNARPKISRA